MSSLLRGVLMDNVKHALAYSPLLMLTSRLGERDGYWDKFGVVAFEKKTRHPDQVTVSYPKGSRGDAEIALFKYDYKRLRHVKSGPTLTAKFLPQIVRRVEQLLGY